MVFFQLISESFLIYFHFFVFNFIIQSTLHLFNKADRQQSYIDQITDDDSTTTSDEEKESSEEDEPLEEKEKPITKKLINIDFQLDNDYNPYYTSCSNIVTYSNGEKKEFESLNDFIEYFSLYSDNIESYIITENDFKSTYLYNELKKILKTNYVGRDINFDINNIEDFSQYFIPPDKFTKHSSWFTGDNKTIPYTMYNITNYFGEEIKSREKIEIMNEIYRLCIKKYILNCKINNIEDEIHFEIIKEDSDEDNKNSCQNLYEERIKKKIEENVDDIYNNQMELMFDL